MEVYENIVVRTKFVTNKTLCNEGVCMCVCGGGGKSETRENFVYTMPASITKVCAFIRVKLFRE